MVRGFKQPPFPPDTAGRGFDALLQWTCVQFGYCGGVVDDEPRHVTDYFPESGHVSANQFAYWAFLAEGDKLTIDQVLCHEHGARIRDAFIHFMSAESVEVQRLA
ncbi:MAG: hypothetical protein IBJ12_10105 [Sphingomonadaceae bacterium]|nr:hypothetical protein [Sphingomonadaceae bacterium]